MPPKFPYNTATSFLLNAIRTVAKHPFQSLMIALSVYTPLARAAQLEGANSALDTCPQPPQGLRPALLAPASIKAQYVIVGNAPLEWAQVILLSDQHDVPQAMRRAATQVIPALAQPGDTVFIEAADDGKTKCSLRIAHNRGSVEQAKIKRRGLNCRGWLADTHTLDNTTEQITQLIIEQAQTLGKEMLQSPTATKNLINKLIPIQQDVFNNIDFAPFFKLMNNIASGRIPNGEKQQKTIGQTFGSVIVFVMQEILLLRENAPMSVGELTSSLATVLSESSILTLAEQIHQINTHSFSTDNAVRKRNEQLFQPATRISKCIPPAGERPRRLFVTGGAAHFFNAESFLKLSEQGDTYLLPSGNSAEENLAKLERAMARTDDQQQPSVELIKYLEAHEILYVIIYLPHKKDELATDEQQAANRVTHRR